MDLLSTIMILLLLYIFGGYRLALELWQRVSPRRYPPSYDDDTEPAPRITVLLTVHNEEERIRERIENLLNQAYPPERFDILVASDGSTDRTDQRVREIGDPRVKLFVSDRQLGKSGTQNLAMGKATGDIVLFTDADTEFDRNVLQTMARPFVDRHVGAATGHALFVTTAGDSVSESQGYYWRYELGLRRLESRLGILAVASGVCMAVRRELFCEMAAEVGEDCLIPLDVVEQGYRVVHVKEALAYDRMEHTPAREFRARVRMTMRNWQGTWRYPRLLNPLYHPGVAWALWSHKILRWLSPFFLIALIFSAHLWMLSGSWLGIACALSVDTLLLLAAIGWFAASRAVSMPVVGTAYSFMLANIGFLVGVLRALAKSKQFAYQK